MRIYAGASGPGPGLPGVEPGRCIFVSTPGPGCVSSSCQKKRKKRKETPPQRRRNYARLPRQGKRGGKVPARRCRRAQAPMHAPAQRAKQRPRQWEMAVAMAPRPFAPHSLSVFPLPVLACVLRWPWRSDTRACLWVGAAGDEPRARIIDSLMSDRAAFACVRGLARRGLGGRASGMVRA